MSTPATEIETTPVQRAQALIDSLDLSIRAEFVPFSRSRNATPENLKKGANGMSLNWRVTVVRNGRDVLTTDYSAGIAHCPSYKLLKTDSRSGYERNMRVQYECEHGKASRYLVNTGTLLGCGSPILPKALDVFYSLVLDSSVLDAGTFEDWAAEYGYDADSREAERIYRACLEIALKLRAGIGDAALSQLRDAFQDY